jgi:hypothetical protein
MREAGGGREEEKYFWKGPRERAQIQAALWGQGNWETMKWPQDTMLAFLHVLPQSSFLAWLRSPVFTGTREQTGSLSLL